MLIALTCATSASAADRLPIRDYDREVVKTRLAAMPLHSIEGIWQFTTDGALIVIERDNAAAPATDALTSYYDYVQGDWENTINFSINRYLSTQMYVHLRYDSSMAAIEGTRWHKWQLKEILSFGLQYRFKTI